MAKTTNKLEYDTIWDFARWIEIPHQYPKTSLIKLTGLSDNIDKLVQ
jgi:hypothetical protein